jgi:hypothetical protein
MAASTRTVTQASEIVQDTMPADSSYDTDGEILSDSIAPFTLRKAFRWVVGLSKSVIGEAGRRKGSTRIQGTPVVLTGKITSSGTTVTGASSLFLSELEDGSWIAGPLGEYREVLSRASDTSLTLVQAFSVDIASSSNFTRLPTLSERMDVIERHLNAVINSDFDYWQRGSSFTTPASLAFTSDRHQVEYDGSIGAFTVSRQDFALGQTDVPDEPRYFYRWAQTGAGSGQTVKRINYKIESVRSFAGKTIQVKFYAKSNSVSAVTVGAVQNFGTGGSPSADVVVTAKSRALSTVWQEFIVELEIPSITGKTIGTDGNDFLNIVFNLPLNAVHMFDLSHWQVFQGTSNKEWTRATNESDEIKKYFNVIPGTTEVIATGFINAVPSLFCLFQYERTMRAVPTVFVLGGFTSGDYLVSDLLSAQSVTGVSVSDITTRSAGVTFSASGLTAYNPGFLQANSSKNLAFDAELP